MDLGLTEEQQLLRGAARDFLRNECPQEHVRAMETDERGYSPRLWGQMASLGWQGLMIPEEYGGAGFSYLDLCVLVEEIGQALLPGPFIPNAVCASILIEAATDAQRQQYLPAIADGSAIHTYAWTEASGRWGSDGVRAQLADLGEGWRLDGVKLFVPDAPAADYLHVIARLPEDDLADCIIARDQPGVTITALDTIAKDRQARVEFTDVVVSADQVIPLSQEALAQVVNVATNLESIYLVGLAQRDFEISVEYAKERRQFGKPIGAFQAIQHKAADMATDVDGMRYLAYRAAWATSERLDSAAMETSMAKAWCGEASERVVREAQQIHGAIGFTREHVIQLYFRRQRRSALFWGDADFHREQLARMYGI